MRRPLKFPPPCAQEVAQFDRRKVTAVTDAMLATVDGLALRPSVAVGVRAPVEGGRTVFEFFPLSAAGAKLLAGTP